MDAFSVDRYESILLSVLKAFLNVSLKNFFPDFDTSSFFDCMASIAFFILASFSFLSLIFLLVLSRLSINSSCILAIMSSLACLLFSIFSAFFLRAASDVAFSLAVFWSAVSTNLPVLISLGN